MAVTTAIATPLKLESRDDASVARVHAALEETAEEAWLRRHLARAPERDEEWIRRALLLQGRT